ncbi:MAG: ferrous iron transport protein B, partial [Syntrophorhabdaceae bacterium]|nr:ferrous iron transport protein B [Syntrophorhabdaceae bacterium]
MKSITIALAGNPNSGKTTIFNRLTGAHQHVGNYPGVTVEIRQGQFKHNDFEIKVVDLPGIYSLTAYSPDEVLARDFIIEEKPDMVVNIIDSSNLERNLYLTVQLMEMDVPLILVFNMSDEAYKKGYKFDMEKFSYFFDAPIVETVGHRGYGIEALKDVIVDNASKGYKNKNARFLVYGDELEKEIERLKNIIEKSLYFNKYNTRWLAIKVLENDIDIIKKLDSPDIVIQKEKSTIRIEGLFREPPEIVIAEKRYGFISGICQRAVRSTIDKVHSISDKIDKIVINRFLGLPIFFGIMYLVFLLTFTIGEFPIEFIESFFKWLKVIIGGLWAPHSESPLKSLLTDGVIGGVGSVLVFLPNILFLFFAISILEDTGYMARAAFIMDRLMKKIGLHGKSFIPMLIGFGCSVPAIMATRTLENKKDRLITMLVIPLMSCGARLPVYTLIIPAFFPEKLYAPMLWIIYITGIALAVIIAKLLSVTVFKGEPATFIMELPPYRMPTLKSILIHIWQRCWLYLKRAGTIILGISIILWLISSFPGISEERKEYYQKNKHSIETYILDEKEKSERLKAIENEENQEKLINSITGKIGKTIEPALLPMGFDWKIGTALIGAFAAKEVFVAQLGIVYSLGEAKDTLETLRQKLKEDYSPLTGFSIMLFILISMPCMATVTITAKESGSWRWALMQLSGLTIIAY